MTQINENRFEKFIIAQLKMGGVNDKTITKILSGGGIQEFRLAFTHKTISDEDNGETYEFLGDVILNANVAYYINHKHPEIVSAKWLTRIKHTLISGKSAGQMAYKAGFQNYVRYGPQIQEKIDKQPILERNLDYIATLEDALEAFLGCLVTLFDRRYPVGVGYGVAHKYLLNFFEGLEIKTDYDSVFDPKTRLKEIFDKQKWGKIKKNLIYKPDGDMHRVTYYGYVLGDKTLEGKNLAKIGEAVEHTRPDAEQAAARKALDNLKRYKIYEKIHDPGTRKR